MDKKLEKMSVTQRAFWLGSSHPLLKKWNESFSETGVTWIWVVGADFGCNLIQNHLALVTNQCQSQIARIFNFSYVHVSLLAGEIEWRVAWRTWILCCHFKRNLNDNEMLGCQCIYQKPYFCADGMFPFLPVSTFAFASNSARTMAGTEEFTSEGN